MKQLKRTLLLGCTLFLLFASAPPTWASTSDGLPFDPQEVSVQAVVQSSTGWNFRVSGYTAKKDDKSPAIAYNSFNDQYLVVWHDGRNTSSRGFDIYGQRLSASGARLGGNFRISGNAATDDDYIPVVVYNSFANEYLVVWIDHRKRSARGSDIYGQRISASGARKGGNFRISGSAATRNDVEPVVAYDSTSHRYLVVWNDARNYDTRSWDVYGQILSSTGSRLGPNRRISGAAATDSIGAPAVAYNSANNQYFVVWDDLRNAATRGYDIYGQRVSPSGARLGRNIRISTPSAAQDEMYPEIAYNSVTNGYVVIWDDSRNSVTRGSDIYGQRLSASGARQGWNFRISGAAAKGEDRWPALAYNPYDNEFLVTWQDDRKSSTRGADIYCQSISPTGARLGKNYRVSGPTATSNDTHVAIAHKNSSYEYIIVWMDARNSVSRGDDIYGQRWESGVSILSSP